MTWPYIWDSEAPLVAGSSWAVAGSSFAHTVEDIAHCTEVPVEGTVNMAVKSVSEDYRTQHRNLRLDYSVARNLGKQRNRELQEQMV